MRHTVVSWLVAAIAVVGTVTAIVFSLLANAV
jgi:hypothetical protein